MDRSANSDTTTLSPTPFSPFSDARSFGSDNGTSDEPADLGDFATVFRALNELRMPPARSSNTMHAMFASAPASRARSRVRQGAGATPTASTSVIPPDYDSEQDDDSDPDGEHDSQSRDPFEQYFSSLRNDIARGRSYGEDYESSSYRIDDTEDQSPDTRRSVISSYATHPTSGDSEMDGVFTVDVDDLGADNLSQTRHFPTYTPSSSSVLSNPQPTLGALDDVFGFISAERAKFAATIDNRLQTINNGISSYGSGMRGRSRGGAGGASSTSESAWKHVVEPRRKRRRKRGKNSASASASASASVSAAASTTMLNASSAAGPSSSGKMSRKQKGGASTRPAEAEEEDAGAGQLDEMDIIEGYGSSSEFEIDSFDVEADPLSSSPSKPYKPFLDSGLSSSSSPIRSRKGKTRGNLPSNLNLNHPLPTNQGRTSRLTHSRSTPSLRTAGLNSEVPSTGISTGANGTGIPSPSDSRVLKLRSLATKLRLWFPEDKQYLNDILRHSDSWISPDDFVDPRGRLPMTNDPLFHVFIDHSNILIGFINHLRRHAPSFTSSRRLKTHLSHAALSLILERGRPITRRVLATSSPLYQPMDGAEKLGYEVRVYARVPDTGDGMDRVGREKERMERGTGVGVGTGRGRKGHTRKISTGTGGSGTMNINSNNNNHNGGGGGTSANSDSAGSPPSAGMIGPTPTSTVVSAMQIVQGPGPLHLGRHGRNGSGVTGVAGLQVVSSVGSLGGGVGGGGGFSPGSSSAIVSSAANGNGTPTTGTITTSSTTATSSSSGPRIRYREQGVDELLQLKLHQAIADSYESLPHGSTIILATGDGNVGQFNEDGFVGCVRTALRKGWRVELYAWEVGVSKAWTREFGKDEKFKIIFLEKYAADMLEVV